MATVEFSPQTFEAWLKADKNSETLKKIATETYHKMERTRVNLPGVDTRLIGPDDIFQEMTFFLLNDENAGRDLLAGGPGLKNRLQGFLWHRIIDMSRSGEGNQDIYKDTWRLFYRHITDVMGRSDQFVKTNPPLGPVVFGRSHEPSRTIVMIEDLMDIAYPHDIPADFQALNTQKNILLLAEYFWNQAARKTREPNIQLGVRDFMFWIGQYVNLASRVDSFPETQDDVTPNNPLAQAGQAPEDVLKKQSLTSWSENFYHLLKDVEKKVFYYYECMGLTHQQISGLMDKKGSLSYQRDKIRDRLKTFLRPLDWVSPDHGREPQDPEDFIFFRNQLCSKLKTAVEGA